MDIDQLLETLDTVPNTRLRLITLAQECTLPDGSLDVVEIASRAQEFQAASTEAQQYVDSTRQVFQAIQCLTSPSLTSPTQA